MQWVKNQLTTHGEVSRNQALRRNITRLGARINDLVNAGWDIHGQFVKVGKGKDYVYTLSK